MNLPLPAFTVCRLDLGTHATSVSRMRHVGVRRTLYRFPRISPREEQFTPFEETTETCESDTIGVETGKKDGGGRSRIESGNKSTGGGYAAGRRRGTLVPWIPMPLPGAEKIIPGVLPGIAITGRCLKLYFPPASGSGGRCGW